MCESDDLAKVFRGMELVAKQAGSLGDLSFCNFHVEAISNPEGLPYTAAISQPNALKEISLKPFPTIGSAPPTIHQ